MKGPSWSEEDDKILTRLWQVEGRSSSEIAARFPGRSRNAVMGRVYRLLGSNAEHPKPASPGERPSKPPVQRAAPKAAPPPREPAQPSLAPVEVKSVGLVYPVTAAARRLTELGTGQCRWPVGHATGADQLFCADVTAAEFGPYCRHHARRSAASVRAAITAARNLRALAS